MIIKKIVCSGLKENSGICELADFVKSDNKIELGLSFTRNKCAKSAARYEWTKEMVAELGRNGLSATLQIGHEWCEDFCNGNAAEEISEILDARDINGEKVCKRVQLSFLMSLHRIEPDLLADTIKNYREHRFILMYNSINKDIVENLNVRGAAFDILYRPYSELESLSINKDFFLGRMQGYAGGFTPDNIISHLEKMALTVYPGTSVYVESYRGLRGEDNGFSLAKAKAFVKNVNLWMEEYSLKKNSA